MTVEVALQLLIQLLAQAGTIGNLIQQAQNQNRDLTEAEVDMVVAEVDVARAKAVAAIKAKLP